MQNFLTLSNVKLIYPHICAVIEVLTTDQAAPSHQGQCSLHREHDAFDVDTKTPVEILFGDVLKCDETASSSSRKDDIEMAMRLGNGGGDMLHIGLAHHIGTNGAGIIAQQRNCLVECVLPASRDVYERAFLNKPPRGTEADS
jgi:hypothetical protein